MELLLTGVWAEALRVFPELKTQIPRAINVALLQEAQDLRKRIVQQFTNQAPAMGQWAPLSPFTLRARRASGFNGSKILIRTGDLRNSIQVQVIGPGLVFVGVNRTAGYAAKGGGRNKKTGRFEGKIKTSAPSSVAGKAMALVNLGLIHEYGATVKVTVTRKMQRFVFGVLMKGGGGGRGRGGGRFKVGAVLTIRIPARPFMAPAINSMSQTDYENSVAMRVAVLLKGKLGKPK